MEKTICELFAGVGGFRLGFEQLNADWETVWFSQWEPNKKRQWAHKCYVNHFGDSPDVDGEFHTNEDITNVDKFKIPDHTLLVGGFPCQDYSVAKPLSSSHGIKGKKGVLWWQIYEILKTKRPPFCLFENVDRLLRSPTSQRGRDFGVMLSCLYSLGYLVEWRVADSSLYGNPQRRKRVYVFAVHESTDYACEMALGNGIFMSVFPANIVPEYKQCTISDNPYKASKDFSFNFKRAGIMVSGEITTFEIQEKAESLVPLKSILEHNVGDAWDIPPDKLQKWWYLKSAKKVERTSKSGHTYVFSEGTIPFPDPIDRPARTMLTSEGTLNRSSHVISDPDTGHLRILTPVETERLNGFPDDWTECMPNSMRYFCMGNALVVPVITRIAHAINGIVNCEG